METPNLRKAAVFLRCLPEEQVAMLLTKLAPEQALAVSAEMAGLVQVSPDEQEEVVRDFAEASPAKMKSDRASEAHRFQFLWDIDAEELSTLLGNEHPQTTALILSHLPAQQAAETLAVLPSEQQTSVIRRLATIRPPSSEIVDEVEQCLRDRLVGAKKREVRGVVGVVKMLHSMHPSAERQLLEEIGHADPNLLHEIRQVMFGVDMAAAS
jgi:flagellar motor switch protein FliG